MAKAKSSMNLEENVASALCYVLTWLTGIIFYFMEKENKTVRFHAMQSILTFIPLTIIGWVVGFIGAPSVSYGGYGMYGTGVSVNPGIPALIWLSWAIWAITGLLWLILMFKAYQGEKFKLPVVGDIAEKHA
ncbi:MAG: DUF4870 domain-containing protein [Candidatus Thermoplasmatota archaeon]|nr:DUF4870 domain-containing protein [Candidatus Thermoplasmatota archaeon]